jgi:hypothetical protein
MVAKAAGPVYAPRGFFGLQAGGLFGRGFGGVGKLAIIAEPAAPSAVEGVARALGAVGGLGRGGGGEIVGETAPGAESAVSFGETVARAGGRGC